MNSSRNNSFGLIDVVKVSLSDQSFKQIGEDELEKLRNQMSHLQNRAYSRRISVKDISHWEDGWKENFDNLMNDELSFAESLIPKYFLKQQYFRFGGSVYKLDSWKTLEKVHKAILLYVIDKALAFSQHNSIIEVGSGSGQNILTFAEKFPEARIIGADWSQYSNMIVNYIATRKNRQLTSQENWIGGVHFDFFSPKALDIQDKVLYTIHSLEQIGKNKDFLEYVLTAGAKLIVSIEPVIEHYSPDSVLGQELIQLHKTKEYLSGYPGWLAEKEKRNEIEVLHDERVDFGTLTAEPYSVFIWRPTMSRFGYEKS